ncbi:MAG: hypothetical protein J6R30_00600 [Bacteroidales bacterium]|nr:hypothetical protein [Bacteroidales bacterium]
MKKILFFILLSTFLVSCRHGIKTSEAASSTITSDKAIYHWKTEFNLNDYELDFIARHDISRIYIKMFDVALQNGANLDTLAVIPIATTRFRSPVPEGLEIIPTVYITLEALSHLKGKDLSYIESYVKRILTRVEAMASYNELPPIKEVQFDCDWTSSTRAAYYYICRSAKQILNSKGKKFSITLRLHQMSKQDFEMPADRGVLMLYNTGSFRNPDTVNSILSYEDAEPYIREHSISYPVDYAYPTYSWNLLFRDNGFKCIIRNIDLTDTSLFQKSDYNRYIARRDTVVSGTPLKTGDMIRNESSRFREIERVKSDLSRRHNMKRSRQIIYHLDSANLSKYTDDEIEYMLLSY